MSIKISAAAQVDSDNETPSCEWSFERAREILARFGFKLSATGGAYRAADIIQALDADREFDIPNPFDRIYLRYIASSAFTAIGSDAMVLACAA